MPDNLKIKIIIKNIYGMINKSGTYDLILGFKKTTTATTNSI